MSKFKELYNADIARYGGAPNFYTRIFHLLYRKAAVIQGSINITINSRAKIGCNCN